MRVAIPHHAGDVAPCFEYSANITIFSVRKNRVVAQMDFTLQSKEALDRIRLLRDQGVTVLICGGIQDAFESLLVAAGIEVISWVTGEARDLLELFLQNKLAPGTTLSEGDRLRSNAKSR
jgi:predicted Fe-Mo cluster-binding NifX family protein